MGLEQGKVCEQLENGKGIRENGSGVSAVDPERFPIRRNANAVGRSAPAPLSATESAGLIRQLDPGYLRAFREIHHGESVQLGELNENAARRAIRVRFEGHGPNTFVEFELPCGLFAR